MGNFDGLRDLGVSVKVCGLRAGWESGVGKVLRRVRGEGSTEVIGVVC
jgi:hypothetical protein